MVDFASFFSVPGSRSWALWSQVNWVIPMVSETAPGDVQLDQHDRHVGKVLGHTDRGLDQRDHDEPAHAELQRLGGAGLPDREQQSDDEPDEE